MFFTIRSKIFLLLFISSFHQLRNKKRTLKGCLLLIIVFNGFNSTASGIPPEAIDIKNFPIQNTSGRSQILPLQGKDSDGTIVNYKITGLPPSSAGTLYLNGLSVSNNSVLTPNEAQILQFEVNSTFTGDAVFTYTVTDNEGLTDSTPASFTIPIVDISQTLVCSGGNLGTNVLGATGTFSTPYIAPATSNNCINNGATVSSPLQNLGKAHPELTNYTYAKSSGSLGPEGTYSFLRIIGTMTSYNCIKGDWVAKDHTGDGGYFMVVNGSPNEALFGKTFYQAKAQQVCPYTLYEFSAYVINVLPGNSPSAGAGSEPDISFYINNTKVSQSGPIAYSTSATNWEPQWIKVGGLWYSGENTSVDLRIDNATFVASGNDLGLDDISLAICGPDITYPDVDLSPKYCAPGILPLKALVKSSINTYTSYIFERSIDGGSTWQTISSPNTGSPIYDTGTNTYSYTAVYGDIPVDVSMNGYKYRLKVATNEANLAGTTCNISAIKVITVSAFNKPSAGNDITGCHPDSTAQLIAVQPGETWSTVPGNPSAATINNSGTVTGMNVNGIYKFVLTNTAGCTDTIAITRDQIISAGQDVKLCAGQDNYKLNDAASGYSWETVPGNPSNAIINPSTGAVTGMTSPGTYNFQLRSGYGSCTDDVTITVPTSLGFSFTQTNVRCATDNNGSIMATGNNGYPPYQYQLNNGSFQESGSMNNLASGNYTLTVKDVNNCTFSRDIFISVGDTLPPAFASSLPDNMTVQCNAVPSSDVVTATDNFGTAIVAFTETRTDGTCPYNYSLFRTWTATDACGLKSDYHQTIVVKDTIAPQFDINDKDFCVEFITNAIIDESTTDISEARPEWYTLKSGSTDLDITNISDNCTSVSDLSFRWKIDFEDGPSLTGNGLISGYGSDIRFSGAQNTTRTDHITYWVTDQCGNETIRQGSIIIHPRPEISKLP